MKENVTTALQLRDGNRKIFHTRACENCTGAEKMTSRTVVVLIELCAGFTDDASVSMNNIFHN
jgi:hypothetical protein